MLLSTTVLVFRPCVSSISSVLIGHSSGNIDGAMNPAASQSFRRRGALSDFKICDMQRFLQGKSSLFTCKGMWVAKPTILRAPWVNTVVLHGGRISKSLWPLRLRHYHINEVPTSSMVLSFLHNSLGFHFQQVYCSEYAKVAIRSNQILIVLTVSILRSSWIHMYTIRQQSLQVN